MKSPRGPAGLSCPAGAAVGGRQDGATRSYRCASVAVGARHSTESVRAPIQLGCPGSAAIGRGKGSWQRCCRRIPPRYRY
jgi:hypothetical protein